MQGPKLEQLHPKLGSLVERTTKAVDLAMEKVVAHHQNPQQYPLPADSKSLERAFHNLFEKLPALKRKKVINKANETLKASSSERTRIYGDLAQVDLRSAVSVGEQVKSLPLPANLRFTQAETKSVMAKFKTLAAKPKATGRPRQAAEASEIGFVVQNLTCVKPNDIRKDEVSLAGFGVDNVGNAFNVAPFFVGKFKKGDTLGVGAGNLFNFKLAEGVFPKAFTASFFLVEKDLLRNSDFINAVIISLQVAGAALVAIFEGMLIVAAAGGPVSVALVIAAAVTGLGLVILAKVSSIMLDDFSFDSIDVLVLDAPVAPGTTFDRSFEIQVGVYRGKYRATAQWIAK